MSNQLNYHVHWFRLSVIYINNIKKSLDKTHYGLDNIKKRILEYVSIKKINKDDYFLYLGRIVPEKGIQYLIEAYQQLNTEKKLVIAGGASDTDEFYSKLKQMALSDKNIIFILAFYCFS